MCNNMDDGKKAVRMMPTTKKKPDSFYKSTRWIKMRNAVLSRDKYMCSECWRYGRRAEAEAVHHIFPREEFPEYEWCRWNLTALCKKCHDAMHDRTTNALTDRGVELLKRTAKRQEMMIPLRYRD